MVMFRTGPVSSRFLPMRTLAPEDCVRFWRGIQGRPARAERWSDARGAVSAELIGRLQQGDRGQLRPFDFEKVPEPELLIVLFGGRRDPDAASPHYLLDNLAPFVSRVQRVYPGRVPAVVCALRQANLNVRSLPSARTWLVADPDKLGGMKVLPRFAPGAGFSMVLMTREGVPLIGGPANDVTEVMNFVDGASDILWLLNPANPGGARDRLHYLRAVRPVEYAESQAQPLLLVDPLRMDALQQRGVRRIEARLVINAEGALSEVELQPGSEIPEVLQAPIAEALRRGALVVPAIERGSPVTGELRYQLKVEEPDAKFAADAAWVKGEARVEIPLKSWLVLKAIKVPEQVFSTIDRVGPDGTVMLKAVTAGNSKKISGASQMNAFNFDWFEDAGPGSVRPMEGAKQEVDGTPLVWKRVKADQGLVDFLGGGGIGSLDYCVGYAWTEFESPVATDAWLGIGSDDGLKVWVNGELVNDKWVERTSRLDDEVVPLRLKGGKNQILVKIQNVKGRWSFTCRLRGRGK
jgi:hypothetical protein